MPKWMKSTSGSLFMQMNILKTYRLFALYVSNTIPPCTLKCVDKLCTITIWSTYSCYKHCLLKLDFLLGLLFIWRAPIEV